MNVHLTCFKTSAVFVCVIVVYVAVVVLIIVPVHILFSCGQKIFTRGLLEASIEFFLVGGG